MICSLYVVQDVTRATNIRALTMNLETKLVIEIELVIYISAL